jgi:hypothetical protein
VADKDNAADSLTDISAYVTKVTINKLPPLEENKESFESVLRRIGIDGGESISINGIVDSGDDLPGIIYKKAFDNARKEIDRLLVERDELRAEVERLRRRLRMRVARIPRLVDEEVTKRG